MSALRGTKHLECKNLHGYLRTLSPQLLDRLYSHPATCLAVFRQLPVLAQHFVMRMLFVEQPVSQNVVRAWVSGGQQSEQQKTEEVLSELRVWHDCTLQASILGRILNPTFRHNLKIALLGGGQPWTGAGALTQDKHSKDIVFLDSYAKERWECVLHYMVSSKEGAARVNRDVVEILLHAGLMKMEAEGEDPFITPGGFQFLLMDTPSQVWYFMLQYLDTAEDRGLNLIETLSFLFQLSFSTLGKDYSTEGMTENQLKFLQHLREFGLVYQRKRKSQRFYPTRLAIHLASGLSKTSTETSEEGYIVVETNYRIYAYTDSPLQIALLSLFCELIYRFPNMVVCNLTRFSVREALTRGITASQIINFLRSYAHPQMKSAQPVIPPTITDMIRLWELERDRFKFNEGVLYNQFLSQSDFEMLRNYARDMDVLVFDNPSRRIMVVTRGGHDDVKKFWKRNKPS